MLPKGILFDLDDTLIDLSSTSGPAWFRVCERFEDRLETVSTDALAEAVVVRRDWFWNDPVLSHEGRMRLPWVRRELVRCAFEDLGIEAGALSDEIGDAFTRDRHETTRPYPGVIEMLEEFQSRGVRLGLITNGGSEEQRSKITPFGLERFLECVLIEEEFGAGKPDPRIYQRAMQALGVEAGDCWMVGDNLEWEVAAPQRLGMKGIWVDVKGDGVPAEAELEPDAVVRNVVDIRTLAL